jgi:hypothetical protein
MEVSVDAKTQLDAARFDERPEAPEYFAILASWLTRHGIARVTFNP